MKQTLDKIVHSYLHTALWTGELDSKFDIKDIHSDSMAQAVKDCKDFIQKAGSLLDLLPEDLAIGHNFWLSRNGHGAGFFDVYLNYQHRETRELVKELGDKLHEIAGQFTELNIFGPEEGCESIVIE